MNASILTARPSKKKPADQTNFTLTMLSRLKMITVIRTAIILLIIMLIYFVLRDYSPFLNNQ
jgi:hypothetical protein